MARLGLNRFARSHEEWLAHCRGAERAGLAALSVGDGYGRDAFVDAAFALAVTESIPVHVSVALPTRSPLQTANAAAGLAAEGGRLTLGLGVGNAVTMENLHGLTYGPPLARLRAFHTCVTAILRAPAGEQVEASNEYYRASGNGFGLDAATLPTIIGAHTPASMRLAAEIAEGIVVHILTPIDELPQRLAAATAGRSEPFTTGAGVITSLDPDEGVALRRARAEVAGVFALPRFAPRIAAHAGPEVAERFAALLAAGDPAGAVDAIPEDTVRAFVLVTTPSRFAADVDAIPTDFALPVPVGIFAPILGAAVGFEEADAASNAEFLTGAIFGRALV